MKNEKENTTVDIINTANSKILHFLKEHNSSHRIIYNPIRYAGGKTLGVKVILNEIAKVIPKNADKIVSLFLGGGSVEFALAKIGFKVVAYDIFYDLINFYNELKNHKEELIASLKELVPNKEEYLKIKKELKDDFYYRNAILNDLLKIPKNYQIKKNHSLLSNLILARDFYFNFNLSYGPSFLGWWSSNYEDKEKYKRMLEKLQNIDCNNLTFETQPFKNVIDKHQNDFLYLDPPYYIEKDNKSVFAGIYPQRNFPIFHNNFDHELLAQKLKNHLGGFVLSYNNSDYIKELYKDCKIIEVKWQYTMGQGETRIGKNRKDKNSYVKSSSEILIIKEPIKMLK